MRLIVFFDLPVNTAAQRKRYRQFRKFLIKDGYLMLQESVYSKLAINEANVAASIGRLKKNRPAEGLVQVLRVTERQYATMVYIAGEGSDREEIETVEEFLVL